VDIFRSVQEEYEYEGIPLDEIKYDDNTDVLDLIEGKAGLLNMLNEECVRPKGSDEAFVQKALAANKKSPCLIQSRMNRKEFGIHHYAGKVMYDSDGFVFSNQDTLPSDLFDCALKCKNEIVSKHLSNEKCSDLAEKEVAPSSNKRAVKRNKSNLVAPTAWSKYKGQLVKLMAMLAKTNSRYIRCINPNKPKKPVLMEHLSTIEQLRCAGVVAAVTLSRSAFPNRLENEVVRFNFSEACISLVALLGYLSLSQSCQNLKRTTSFSFRLGNADRERVTAATTPAHRSCSMVLKCSIKTGFLGLLGLIQRM
jgi:myosin-5